jgi:hypothetical protein
MKNALVKTAFVFSVILLTIVFLMPAQSVLEYVLLDQRNADGTLRSVDRLLPGIIVLFFCIWAADRITGLLFSKTHLLDQRWSLMPSRRSRRSG